MDGGFGEFADGLNLTQARRGAAKLLGHRAEADPQQRVVTVPSGADPAGDVVGVEFGQWLPGTDLFV